MGAGKRIASFGGGGLVGFLIGAGVAKLTAAQSGGDLRAAVAARIREVKAAGDAAQAAAEQRLIARFRGDVDDPTALAPEAQRAADLRARAGQASDVGPGGVARSPTSDAGKTVAPRLS